MVLVFLAVIALSVHGLLAYVAVDALTFDQLLPMGFAILRYVGTDTLLAVLALELLIVI